MEKQPYNDQLDADKQITTEEGIATLIYDLPEDRFDGVNYHTSEEDAGQAGRDILYTVLQAFRPDLFGETDLALTLNCAEADLEGYLQILSNVDSDVSLESVEQTLVAVKKLKALFG